MAGVKRAEVSEVRGGRTPLDHPPLSDGNPDTFVDAVLELTELIPPGRVLTYGDVAELLACGGPRQVGSALSRSTRAVPWWRVLRSGGHPPQGLAARARAHYDDEGTAVSSRAGAADPSAYRVDLRRARWMPSDADHARIEQLAEGLRPARPPVGPATGPATGPANASRPSNVRGV